MAKYFDTRGSIGYLFDTHGVVRTEATLRRYRVQGLGPKFFKMGNDITYTDETLDAWVESERTAHSSTADYDPKWRRPKSHLAARRNKPDEQEADELFGPADADAA